MGGDSDLLNIGPGMSLSPSFAEKDKEQLSDLTQPTGKEVLVRKSAHSEAGFSIEDPRASHSLSWISKLFCVQDGWRVIFGNLDSFRLYLFYRLGSIKRRFILHSHTTGAPYRASHEGETLGECLGHEDAVEGILVQLG